MNYEQEIARLEREIEQDKADAEAMMRGEWTDGMRAELLKELPSILRFAELGDLDPLRRAAKAVKP